MKRIIKALTLVVLFTTCISWMNCGDDNPLAPSSLAGTWNLVTFTDKENNVTVNAGEATDIGGGIIFTVTGSLVLTETRYTFTLSITISCSPKEKIWKKRKRQRTGFGSQRLQVRVLPSRLDVYSASVVQWIRMPGYQPGDASSSLAGCSTKNGT